MAHRISFVSTRLAGTDGVSLETGKWVSVLKLLGHQCFFFAGELDWPAEYSYVVLEASFKHPAVEALTFALFGARTRPTEISDQVSTIKHHLKQHLHRFVRAFELNLLVVENALSIPMNVPLGLALAEFIAETGIMTIAHHHDFHWERDRFTVNAADDYLRTAFPPVLPSLHHVVINSFGASQLAFRTGASSELIPNVMNFEAPPPALDAYALDLRPALGIKPDQCLLLQPTRIVPRKRIERAIELAHGVGMDCVLVVSHDVGDEGTEYSKYLQHYARLLNVPMLLAADVIDYSRSETANGRRIFSLADVYQQADLVTYPSRVEGFGNALLEAMYYRRPIVVSGYEIFKVDMQAKGFKVIEFADFINDKTIEQSRAILSDPENCRDLVEHNYELGKRYYSYSTLERSLVFLLNACLGCG